MTHIMAICLAALANVALNLSLKELSRALPVAGPLRLAQAALVSPWFWIAGISGVSLIGLFMVAIRQGSVAVTYIGVTSLAMLGLTLAAAVFQGDMPGPLRLAGLGLILLGLALTLSDLPPASP